LFLPQLTNQFAWAVPNARALAIIAHFAPIVEVGSGTGYWAGELKARGVDINAYDIDVSEPDTLWDKVYIYIYIHIYSSRPNRPVTLTFYPPLPSFLRRNNIVTISYQHTTHSLTRSLPSVPRLRGFAHFRSAPPVLAQGRA
jgi:hypothetical protein